MDTKLHQRLIKAEANLLSALLDDELLPSFYSTWASLQSDITEFHDELAKETLELAHSVASRVSAIAQCYLDIHQEQRLLMDGLANGVDEILRGSDEGFPSKSSNTAHFSREGLTPFIASAYSWLLDNVHNPYPSAQLKASIAENCGCSQNSVNTWFISARRRIGWTSLCREQFRNCRADATDAAYRALVRSDSSRPLPASVVQAFVAIKVNAEELYSSTFAQSALAKDLDAVVKDLSACDGQILVEENLDGTLSKKSKTQACHKKQRLGSIDFHVSSVSPSPPPASAIPALVSSLSDESEDEEQLDVAPPLLAGRKRSASNLDQECPTRLEQSRKRPCNYSTGEEARVSNSNPEYAILPRSRRRRLSEINQQTLPKRPRGLPAASRLQAVSDPLPRTTAPGEGIDNWFQTNFTTLFDFPAPVNCLDFDSSALWEVNLFDGYSLPPAVGKGDPSHLPFQSSPSVSSLKTSAAGDADLIGHQGLDNLFPFVTEIPERSTTRPTTPIFPPEDGPEVLSELTQTSDLLLPDDWTALFASSSPTFSDTPRYSEAGYYFPEAVPIVPTLLESMFSYPSDPTQMMY